MDMESPPPDIPAVEGASESDKLESPPAAGTIAEEIDWWSLDYENLSSELTCPICQTAFVQPVTTKCGHTFCQQCIESTRNSALTFTCPVDRKPISGSIDRSPYLVSGLVNDLIVTCPNASRGCTFKGKRWLLQSHIESHCQCARVFCKPPCDKLVERRHYVEGQCSHIIIECPNMCGITLAESELKTHLNTVCDNQLVQCPDCLIEQTRKQSKEHSLQCEMATVHCTGESAGCKWQGRRKDVGSGESHISLCPLAMVAPIINRQSRRIETLENENSILKTHFELLRRQVRDSPQQDMHLMMEYERVRHELDHVLSTTENHVKQLMMVARENVRITEDIAFLRNGLSSLRHQMHYLNMAQRRTMFPMANFVPPNQQERTERPSDGPRHDIKL